MTTGSFRDLSPLLNPRAIAVVGASERHGSAGRLVLENLRHLGYQGAIYAVHPKHKKVLGFPSYPDLDSLPGPVDSVAVLLAAEKVLPTLETAVEADAQAAWVLASGFAEAGPEGEARQAELARLAEETGLIVCGPNCIGVANLVDRVATYSVALSPATRAGGVSAVVQSGAICLGLANAARFGFRYLISSGNEAVLDSADYIGYLAGDPQTRVIIAFVEGIRSPQKFVAAAAAAAEAGKPILLVKVGRSEAARQAVQAHTGSLAGSDAVCDAVFRRLGVMRLDTLDELVEAAELFLTCPLPQGEGVGLLSLSGGQIGLVADLAQDLGLKFPPFSEEAQRALAEILPPYSPIANPLDAWGTGDLERTYPACVEVVSREKNIHLLAVSRDTPPQVASREVEQSLAVAEAAVRAARETGKPVLVFSNLSTGFQPEAKKVLDEGGVPYLQGTRETLRAIQTLVCYAGFRRRMGEPIAAGCPSPSDLPHWRRKLQEKGTLSEIEGRHLLASYGIPGPREAVATTAEEAVEAARRIGYPVVLKIISPHIPHKTEMGGVRVGLRDETAVVAAFREVTEAARRHHPQARLEGVVIQEMIPADAVEVIVGVLRDPDFGPVVVFGSGGVLVELLEDSSLRLPPLSHEEALEMIHETRGARLLHGFRGRPPADIDALADALVRLSQLAVDLGDLIAALDANPLMVLPRGQGVRAVDALVEVTSL
ncbi:MAG: acetate--CoA ligase family protein [Chloroflexi bacterium]|nr:acetate--CoA ligase family protein [Chloroflexota bacterium]